MKYTYTPLERIKKGKSFIQKTSPFFAHLVMNMDVKENKDIPSMGVNFKGNASFNPEWINSLTLEEIQGVLCHEVMHVALTHLVRLGTRDHFLWNVATDLLINYMLLREGFKLPKGALLPDINGDIELKKPNGQPIHINVKGKVAEQIYDLLKHECDGDDDGEGKDKGRGGQGDGSGNGQGDGSGNGGNSDSNGGWGGFDEHEYGNNLSDADREEIVKEWKGKLVDAYTSAKNRGNVPGYLTRVIDGLLKPKLNWKALLSQWITRDIKCNETMSRPNKRSWSIGNGTDIYLPSPIKENLNIAVSVDCSGSISNDEYKQFITEITSIANAFEQINMELIHWDTEVRQVTQVNRNNRDELFKIPVEAGGGTTMSCLAEHYLGRMPPMLMVHLTDGYTEYDPELPSSKHLFVISSGGTDGQLKDFGIITHLGD